MNSHFYPVFGSICPVLGIDVFRFSPLLVSLKSKLKDLLLEKESKDGTHFWQINCLLRNYQLVHSALYTYLDKPSKDYESGTQINKLNERN